MHSCMLSIECIGGLMYSLLISSPQCGNAMCSCSSRNSRAHAAFVESSNQELWLTMEPCPSDVVFRPQLFHQCYHRLEDPHSEWAAVNRGHHGTVTSSAGA